MMLLMVEVLDLISTFLDFSCEASRWSVTWEARGGGVEGAGDKEDDGLKIACVRTRSERCILRLSRITCANGNTASSKRAAAGLQAAPTFRQSLAAGLFQLLVFPCTAFCVLRLRQSTPLEAGCS